MTLAGRRPRHTHGASRNRAGGGRSTATRSTSFFRAEIGLDQEGPRRRDNLISNHASLAAGQI
jgi:hypothetical protein